MSGAMTSLNVNSTITYATALAIILGARLISPIIAHIIIYIFHKLFKVDNKIVNSGFMSQ